MSSLKVLLLGDNPNIILHASRFQLANSVDLYHVSESKSNHYEIETRSYGVESFQLTNHFTSIVDLSDATNNKLLFDLIILSATSLQELSTVSSQLSPLITNNTKIFVESTGSVQLEPFVRMSINCNHHVNVLSVVSDLDIRQIDAKTNKYKQFGVKGKQNTIYLGDGSSKSYGSTTQNLLNTFERLFTKLFPNESLNLCDFSSKQFLKIQWELALTQICFDPLLIMLEETSTKNLPNLILAKPLISGLVNEVISIINKMGVQLDDTMNSESTLLTHWQSIYPDEVPPLVYHFINKTYSLNTDLIWLQIILLADDQNIKTPYLEFLYSTLSQLQKVNNNESKWFTRAVEGSHGNNKQNDELINSLKNENNHLSNELNSLQQNLKAKENQLTEFQTTIEQLKNQLSSIKGNQNQTVNDYEVQIQNLNQQINDLKLAQSQQQIINNTAKYSQDNKMVNKNLESVQASSVSYKSTGTPDLNDLEDLAVFGVSYGDSPLRTMNKSQKGEPQQPTSSNGSATSQNMNTNSSDSNTSQGDADESRVLQERELDLKRKELELQERELELQRRALQQQQQQYSGRKSKVNNQMPPPQLNPMNPRNQSYNQMPQQNFAPNMRPNRNLHGATASGSSAANFNDPITGAGMGFAGGFPQPQQQLPPQQQQQQQQSQQFHHAIKPTSRKNRTSNMPNLRNPSNSNMTGFQGNMMNNVPPSINSQSRLNSLSSQSMNFQTRMRNPQQGQQGQQQNMHSTSFNNLNSNIRANTMQHMPAGLNQQQLQQRQISSSSVDVNNVGNISTNSVVHNQLRPTGSMSNVNMMQQSTTMPSLQQSEQSQPQQSQAHVPIQLGTPPIPPSASNLAIDSSPASFASNNTTSTSQTTDSEKKKKKKFGFFKKKSKK